MHPHPRGGSTASGRGSSTTDTGRRRLGRSLLWRRHLPHGRRAHLDWTLIRGPARHPAKHVACDLRGTRRSLLGCRLRPRRRHGLLPRRRSLWGHLLGARHEQRIAERLLTSANQRGGVALIISWNARRAGCAKHLPEIKCHYPNGLLNPPPAQPPNALPPSWPSPLHNALSWFHCC